MYLPEAQYRAAFALALAHEHEWAMLCHDWKPAFPVAVEEIQARLYRAGVSCQVLGMPRGIQASPDGVGYVTHVSGTGRSLWLVGPDGAAKIIVGYHKGVDFIADVTPDGRVELFRQRGTPLVQSQVDCLTYAIRALVPSWELPGGALGKIDCGEETA